MATLNLDREKIDNMVIDTLRNFQNNGAHPAEIVIALGESVGRVIAAVQGTDILRKDLLDIAIKQMAGAVLAADHSRIITQ